MPLRWFLLPLLAGLAWGANERQAVERAVAEFAAALPARPEVWTERTRPASTSTAFASSRPM